MIEGELTVWAHADKRTIGPGGFVVIPMHTPHMIQAGPNGARALNISSPAGFAELIERTATPGALSGPDTRLDLDRFMQVTTELGDVVLGVSGHHPRSARPAAARPLADAAGSRNPHERHSRSNLLIERAVRWTTSKPGRRANPGGS